MVSTCATFSCASHPVAFSTQSRRTSSPFLLPVSFVLECTLMPLKSYFQFVFRLLVGTGVKMQKIFSELSSTRLLLPAFLRKY